MNKEIESLKLRLNSKLSELIDKQYEILKKDVIYSEITNEFKENDKFLKDTRDLYLNLSRFQNNYESFLKNN